MFKNSVTILHVAGIPIRLHISFLLILGFLVLVIGNNIGAIADMAGIAGEELTANPFLLGLILAILLFTSIALHELAHSFVARSQGIEIREITLMLLGGVAQMRNEGDDKDEVWMAFAGPLFSLVFGALLLYAVRPLAARMMADVHLVVYYLGFMNIFLGFFNLLPAFPSDGGRILRSLIARRTSYLQATRIATSVGKAFAILFGVVGFVYGHLFLILIAFFIYIGATQEYQFNVVKDAFSDFRVRDLMTADVSTVTQDMTVAELLELMHRERHSGYPVMDDQSRLVGCVTLHDVRALGDDTPGSTPIGDIMNCELITIRPQDELFYAFKKLSEADVGRLMVVEDGQLRGILTRSDIMKAYRLRALQDLRRAAP